MRVKMAVRVSLLAAMMAGVMAGQGVRGSGVEAVAANLPQQPIGARDLVAVTVLEAPEVSRTVRVTNDGKIQLPLLRTPIEAAGVMPAELEHRIAKALKDAQILVDPVVTVNIVEYVSRPITVVGAVKKPLTFQATGPTTLLEALSRAEGLSGEAGPEIVLSRSGKGPGLLERIPVKELIENRDPRWNVRLEGGDEVRVPEAGRVYVVGNVKKPGAFPMHEHSESSVLKLLALSEGLLPFASKVAYIYRAEADGRRKEVPVELQKVVDRKAPDPPVSVGDILYVPDNKNKRTSMMVLDRALSFGLSTASGVLIWGAAAR
jgi:polysaccharide export outer membrane protein